MSTIQEIFNDDFEYSIGDYYKISSIEQDESFIGCFHIYVDNKLWRTVYSQNVTVCYTKEVQKTYMKEVLELPDYGDLLTVEEFKDMCEKGLITDSDGSGYYAYKETYSRNNPVSCRRFLNENENYGFTHVIWFNK